MRMERSKVKHSRDHEYLRKELGMTIFQGSFSVSDCTEGSDDSKVGFGGVDSMLGKAWHGEGEGRAKEMAKAKGQKRVCARACESKG